MNRFCAAFLLLFVAISMVGCGGDGNTTATQDEMKAHVEKYGDTALDPSASSSDPLPK